LGRQTSGHDPEQHKIRTERNTCVSVRFDPCDRNWPDAPRFVACSTDFGSCLRPEAQVMTNPSTKGLLTIAMFAAPLAACGTSPSPDEQNDSTDPSVSLRHHRQISITVGTGGATGGSTVSSSSSATAGSGGIGGSGATSSTRVVACYSGGAPSATCTGNDHCCFSNYSASHDGYCSADACEFGRMECDGPEDCAPDNVCCAERLSDPAGTGYALGYVVACRTGSACPTGTWQLCHTSSTRDCGSGRSCQPSGPVNAELPQILGLCVP